MSVLTKRDKNVEGGDETEQVFCNRRKWDYVAAALQRLALLKKSVRGHDGEALERHE